jgi:zinc transport system substrate-binding protein
VNFAWIFFRAPDLATSLGIIQGIFAQWNPWIFIDGTLFPQYDFAKIVGGERAEVSLLLLPGVEAHSYDPKPSDMIKMSKADMLIYTGKYMEPWSERVFQGLDNFHGILVDVSEGIPLSYITGQEEYHHHDEVSNYGEAYNFDAEHYHGETHNHAKAHHHNEPHQQEHLEEGQHQHLEYEPHIWTDPKMAMIMVDNIVEGFCEIDPEYAEEYRLNGENYKIELAKLHEEFKKIVQNGRQRDMVFGSRFALYYFTKQYGLGYCAAFDSCSSETEPSAKAIASIIKKIKEEDIKVIYYGELSDQRIAEAIGQQTGAKPLLFHSCHNVSKEEFEEGATYLSLMRQNAANLKEGLK